MLKNYVTNEFEEIFLQEDQKRTCCSIWHTKAEMPGLSWTVKLLKILKKHKTYLSSN